jgi:hypothetical protein
MLQNFRAPNHEPALSYAEKIGKAGSGDKGYPGRIRGPVTPGNLG